MPLAGVTVIRFGIVASVSQGRIDTDVRQSRVEQRHEPIRVGLRATAGEYADHQVTVAVEGGFQLGVSAVRYGLPLL